jgi:hypothetical protein
MIRILWLLIVGSWRFPWEKREERQLPMPKSRLGEYTWEDRTECGHKFRVDERHPLISECNGAPSEWCSAGRCRVHCQETCKCETTRPDVPEPLLEAPRDPPISTGAAYR